MSTTLRGVEEIRAYLNLRNRSQAQNLIDRNLIPFYRVGRIIYSTTKLLDDWRAEQESAAVNGYKRHHSSLRDPISHSGNVKSCA